MSLITRFFSILTTVSLVMVVTAVIAFAAIAWPASGATQVAVDGTVSGSFLPSNWQPSGLMSMDNGELVVVSNTGRIDIMDENGNLIRNYPGGGNLEGVTAKDPISPLVYLAYEIPDIVKEFNIDTGIFTGEEWNLQPWTSSTGNQGLEALTYAHGYFFAGRQAGGRMFMFDLQTGNAPIYITDFSTPVGSDLAGLYYDDLEEVIYAMYDWPERLVRMHANSEIVNALSIGTLPNFSGYVIDDINLPTASNEKAQEGVTLSETDRTKMFIAQDDDPGAVWSYTGFPYLVPSAPPVPVPWPAGTGQEFVEANVGGVPNDFEPSGIIEMSAGTVVASDEGDVFVLDSSGTVINSYSPGGDIESLTTIDPYSDFVYFAVQDTGVVNKFDIVNGTVVESWDVSNWSANITAMTYAEGYFFIGDASSADMYMLDLQTGGNVNYITDFNTEYNSDLSGLYYDDTGGRLYALYDSENRLVTYDLNSAIVVDLVSGAIGDLDAQLIEHIILPVDSGETSQQGITLGLFPTTDIYITQDIGGGSGVVWVYGNFPTDQPDLPNLRVNIFGFNPMSQRLWYNIENNGTLDLPVNPSGFDTIYIDGSFFELSSWNSPTSVVNQYAPSGSIAIDNWVLSRTSLLFPSLVDGSVHTIQICVDYPDFAEEIYEDDNCDEIEWTYIAEVPDGYGEIMPHNEYTKSHGIEDFLNGEEEERNKEGEMSEMEEGLRR